MTSLFKILIILSVALVFLLTIMLTLAWQHAKQQMKRDKEELQRLRELLENHTRPKLKTLEEWKTEVHTAIRLSDTDRPKRRGEERDEYDRKLFNRLLHCDQYEKLFSLVDQRLNRFASRLRQNFQLGDRELMFICLSVLDLSDEQIALLMEYSVASIPTTRKRIGKKLGAENLSDWKQQLLNLIDKN